jgi:hypothetical protein
MGDDAHRDTGLNDERTIIPYKYFQRQKLAQDFLGIRILIHPP